MVLVESSSTLDRLPSDIAEDARVVNRAILSHIREVPEVSRRPYVVFSSPLERRKGPRLALEALAKTKSGAKLLFIHHGPEEGSLRSRARELGVADRVEFRGRVPRDEMWSLIAGASASVFAGLREEGGCALAEAMLAGSPVIVLGHGGARLLAESHLDADRMAIIEPSSAEATIAAFAGAMDKFVTSIPQARSGYLDQESTKRELEAAVRDVIHANAHR
jgi:glycosyltransferase involved in cell wall biosynthesis